MSESPTASASTLRRHFGKLALLLALLALAVLAAPRVLHGPEVALETVLQRDFVQSVVSSGRVEAPHRVSVGSQLTGTVARVPVAEGQEVAAGALLIELEPSEQVAAQRQAELAVAQAQARLRQLRELQVPVAEQALRQAQANADTARQSLARNRDLLAQGFIGQAAVDESQRALAVAEAQLESARAQRASLRPDGPELALADAAFAQAQAGVDAARARLRLTRISAPVAGTLISRNVEPGDVVQPGKTLMQLSPAGPTQLVLQIDEKNLRLLQPGQQALASADAYPAQRFAAELVYINPGVDAQRGAVEVKLRVPAPPPTLKQDMTVSVDIEVARRANAVLVPATALRDADGAAPWVLKLTDGHVRRQAVQLGLRSGGYSEVLAGLRAGDQLVPAGAALLRDGDRVRAAPAAVSP